MLLDYVHSYIEIYVQTYINIYMNNSKRQFERKTNNFYAFFIVKLSSNFQLCFFLIIQLEFTFTINKILTLFELTWPFIFPAIIILKSELAEMEVGYVYQKLDILFLSIHNLYTSLEI